MTEPTTAVISRKEALQEQALMAMEMFSATDTAHKLSLLSIASRSLSHLPVLESWVMHLAAETDGHLKMLMTQRLLSVPPQLLAGHPTLIDTLLKTIAQDPGKEALLELLGRLSMANAALRQKLMALYPQQQDTGVQELLLYFILQAQDISAEEVAFCQSILPTVGVRYKYYVLWLLLRQEKLPQEQLRTYLHPSQPADVRQLVLRYCLDRSLYFEAELLNLLTTDEVSLNRCYTVQLIALSGLSEQATGQLLKSLQADPDEQVRAAIIAAFGYALQCTPEVIKLFGQYLASEKEAVNIRSMIDLLLPYGDGAPELRDLLLHTATRISQVEIALHLYTSLGTWLPLHKDLFTKYLTAWQAEQRTDCKAAMLKAISAVPAGAEELVELFTEALQAPSLELQTWALKGFLQLPLSEKNVPAFDAVAPVLTDTRIDREIRQLLVQKTGRIPVKTPAMAAAFKKIIDQDSDEKLKEICRNALTTDVQEQGSDVIDWEQWLYQVDVDHTLDGIFPSIFLHYKSNPAMAKKILLAALQPGCARSLYRARVADLDILHFLNIHNAIDEHIAQYCINQILNDTEGRTPNPYLRILKSHPAPASLGSTCWALLEKAPDLMNMLMMRELLEAAYGKSAAREVEAKMLAAQTPNAIRPYLVFLAQTLMPVNLAPIAGLPAVQTDKDNAALLKDLAKKYDLKLITPTTPAAPGPGFAD